MNMCLITGIFPPDIGGPATYVNRLAHSFQQSGHTVVVVTLGDDQPSLPFPVIKISRRYPLPLKLLLLFIALLRSGWRSEVWYINGLELPAVLAGKVLRKRLMMKIVSDYAWERAGNQGLTTDTVQEFQHKKQCWKVECHKMLRAWLARQVDAVITPSLHVQRIVRGWGVADERLHLVYNAVEPIPDHLEIPLALRRQLGVPDDAYMLITVGRLIPLKGIDQIIRAIARFRDQRTEKKKTHLFVIGDGPEKKKLTELSESLSVTERIHFIGQIERQQVLAYLNASDLFVLNSSTEGFSHVLLEAMIVGVPVIATNVGGNPELVQHEKNGILIPYGDFEELTAQILRVLHDEPLRRRFIEYGQQTAQQFLWEYLLCQTTQILLGDQ